jgi:hypothetical protein
VIRLRKGGPLNGGSFFFLEIARVGSNPALGLNDLNHQTRIAPTTTTKRIVNFIGLAHRRHRLILRLTKSANRSVINSTIASTSQL